jgi:predicted nucleotidyltransferase
MLATAEILERIVALLASDPRVGAIYLFGSVADEVAGDHSDIDLALLSHSLHNPLDLDAIIHLRTVIAGEFPSLHFDLVLVDQCPPVL